MLQFRPHHFLCTMCFKGKGYSPEFVKNYKDIFESLDSEKGDEVQIEVTGHTDSICAPCPHKIDKKCKTEEKVQALDAAHAKVLDIKPGDVMTWKEATKRITKNIDIKTFNKICAPCNWKKLGICKSVV